MAESFFGKIVERAGAVFDQIANEYIVFDNLVRSDIFIAVPLFNRLTSC